MKTLLYILGITGTEIGRRAGVSAAAVSLSLAKKRGRGYETARKMIEEARFDVRTEGRVADAIEELRAFQLGITP